MANLRTNGLALGDRAGGHFGIQIATFSQPMGTTGDPDDHIIWVPPRVVSNSPGLVVPDNWRVLAVSYSYETEGGAGADFDLRKLPDGTAQGIGNGTRVLNAAPSLSSGASADKVVQASPSATEADAVLATTDRLGLFFGGTLTGLQGFHLSVYLLPLPDVLVTRAQS